MQKFRDRVIAPLRRMQLADATDCVAAGVLGGLCPIPSATTMTTIAVSYTLRLSKAQSAVAVALNMLITPIDIALVPLFVWLGALLCPSGVFHTTSASVLLEELARLDGWTSVRALGVLAVLGCVPWLILSAVAILVYTKVIRRMITRGDKSKVE